AMAELGARIVPPSASLLRLLDAHARARGDAQLASRTCEALATTTSRPHEQAALLLRASDMAADAGDTVKALVLATRASEVDAG
ncbi:hypothetical protein, partial [Klebsiella pneumoniae]|uniref:hypothetical protein n=1 Tax=Klebsiella pneumoniae TaxID=573 RepID=UPI003853F2DE